MQMLHWFVICKYFSGPIEGIILPVTASIYHGAKNYILYNASLPDLYYNTLYYNTLCYIILQVITNPTFPMSTAPIATSLALVSRAKEFSKLGS